MPEVASNRGGYMNTVLARSLFIVLLLLYATSVSAWTTIRNFNDGTVGANAKGSDAFSGSAGDSYYSNEQVSEGPLSAELNITAGETAFGSWGGAITFPSNLYKGDEIWLRVKTFMPVGFNYNSTSNGNRLKFLRVHTMSPSAANQGYDDWYINPQGSSTPFSWIYEGEQKWVHFGDSGDAIQLGKWETYEMYLYLDDLPTASGGKARIRLWKDGVLLQDITDRKTLKAADSYAEKIYIFTYWNGGAPKTQKMWMDDIVVTTETPDARDAQNNPYIGIASSSNYPAKPSPPIMIGVQ